MGSLLLPTLGATVALIAPGLLLGWVAEPSPRGEHGNHPPYCPS